MLHHFQFQFFDVPLGGQLFQVSFLDFPDRAGKRLRLLLFKAGLLEFLYECVGVEKTKRGKGTKWMVVVDGKDIPLGSLLESATPSEVKLIEPLLKKISVPRKGPGRPRKKPQRLIYDRATDSNPLRERLKKQGIDLICPHRKNRVKPAAQNGRKLRRYSRRWKVERTIAWIGNFRRLTVHYERHLTMYNAFFHIACMLITLRQL